MTNDKKIFIDQIMTNDSRHELWVGRKQHIKSAVCGSEQLTTQESYMKNRGNYKT